MKKLMLFMAITTCLIFVACGKYECSQCDKTFKTEEALNKHIQKVHNDTTDTTHSSKIEKAEEPDSIRVYIDNSGSMRGYTEGQNSVFINAISDLKSVKNGEAYFWGAKPRKPITGIIGGALAKNSFNGQETPFPSMIAQLEHEAAKSGALTFIVTDGIIGVSSKQSQYLQQSLGQIKNDIRDSAKVEQGMAISVFRLVSGYSNKSSKSYYYTHKNTPVKLDSANQRPFFVIVIGKRANIQWFMNKVLNDGSLSAYKSAASITFGLHNHEVKLALSDRLAFEQKGGSAKLKKTKGTFSLKANIPSCLAQDPKLDYIKQNLEVKLNDEQLSCLTSAKIDKDDPKKGFFVDENTLYVIYDQVRNISTTDNVITIRLKKTIPTQWTTQWSSDDDSDIAKNQMEQTRTFALSYLLNGLYEATDGDQMLLETKFEFKK